VALRPPGSGRRPRRARLAAADADVARPEQRTKANGRFPRVATRPASPRPVAAAQHLPPHLASTLATCSSSLCASSSRRAASARPPRLPMPVLPCVDGSEEAGQLGDRGREEIPVFGTLPLDHAGWRLPRLSVDRPCFGLFGLQCRPLLTLLWHRSVSRRWVPRSLCPIPLTGP
jgi:hypothetical protein